jgi:hypothetical protein
LGTTFAGGNDIDVGDEALFDSVKTSFVSCGITTPPITTPDN